MTKTHLFLENHDQSGGAGSSFCWWRTLEEFDDDGNFKFEVSDISKLTPRIKVLREMERLGLVSAEVLDDFRHKLLSYRAGDLWVPVGGIKKEDVDIPPTITILLTGLTSSGKSSLINLMYSVLGASGLIPFAQTSGETSGYTTMYLEEHNVLRSPRSGVCVYDSRGLEQSEMEEGIEEVSRWMWNGVRHNQPCYRSGDDDHKLKGSSSNYSRYVKRKVNCVMVVADLSKIHKAFKSDDLKSIAALRALFHLDCIKNSNENPILILTHGDALTADDRVEARVKICEYLGIPETSGAYDIACLTEQGVECDPVTAFALTEAVYRALLQSDRSHPPKKKFNDYIVAFFRWIMSCVACLFAILSNFFSKFGHHNKKLKM